MNFPHVPCIKENSREFRVFRVTCPSALCVQNIPEEETIHLSSDKTHRLQKTEICQSTLFIYSICLFETIHLKLKQSFLSNMRRKCSLSYMVWTVFLGLSFTLNFLWIEWKIKWHLSRMFLSFEPCRPTSTTLHSL